MWTEGGVYQVADVDEMLRRNSQIRAALQKKYGLLQMRYRRLAALRAALYRAPGVTKRKLSERLERVDDVRSVRFLEDYVAGAVGQHPFRDAGIFALKNSLSYAPLPLSEDEKLWEKISSIFPSLWHTHSLPMLPETAKSSDSSQWSREEDIALTGRVHAYKGARCGPSFWKAVGTPERPRFEVASHYVRVQQHGLIEPREDEKALSWNPKEQRNVALQEAVWQQVGDEGLIMVAYVNMICAAARRCVYVSEVTRETPLVFPPYVWLRRTTFNWLISPLVSEARASAALNSGEHSGETPSSAQFRIDVSTSASMKEMIVCFLALKGKVFGETCGLRFIERVFLPNNRIYALRGPDFTEGKRGRKHKLDEEQEGI